jgi:4'-phosphopantetheinyl transferase
MEAIVLEAPAGIDARLGWDPAVPPHDRKRILTRDLVAGRLGIFPGDVHVAREEPTVFGHHTHLIPTVGGEPVPFAVRDVSFRAATVVAIADLATPLGLDLRDLLPDPQTTAAMHAHSHLWEGSSETAFLTHWARVQAILAADGRGRQVRPEAVRLDGATGWIPDRPVHYRLVDLSRNAFVITLAYAQVPVHPGAS